MFLDIGVNIGVFILEMVKLGWKIIVVELFIDNIKRLCCFVYKGKFGDLVIIIVNVILSCYM